MDKFQFYDSLPEVVMRVCVCTTYTVCVSECKTGPSTGLRRREFGEMSIFLFNLIVNKHETRTQTVWESVDDL